MCRGQRERCSNSLHLLSELYTSHWIRLSVTNCQEVRAHTTKALLKTQNTNETRSNKQQKLQSYKQSVFLLAFISKKHKKRGLRKIPFLALLFLYFFSVIMDHHIFASPPVSVVLFANDLGFSRAIL